MAPQLPHARKRLANLRRAALVIAACGPNVTEQCCQLGHATGAVEARVQAAHQAQIGQPVYDPEYDHRLAAAWGTRTASTVPVKGSSLA
ncbi:MAG: hypothetical protein O3C67_06410 [Cyanobacteria bacterium]|nr:hypothetical protein [Cyanobacteriota bacterium]